MEFGSDWVIIHLYFHVSVEGSLRRARRYILLTNDVLCLSFSLLAAIWLRYENLNSGSLNFFLWMMPVSVLAGIGIFGSLGLYRRSVRFTSIPDLVAIFTAVTALSIVKMFLLLATPHAALSRAVFIMDWVLGLFLIGFSRVTPRILLTLTDFEPVRKMVFGEVRNRPKRILIYGAGRGGESVAREIRRNEQLPYSIVGFLDDDSRKLGSIIHGAEVLGDRSILNRVCHEEKVEEIVIAIPSASGEVIREIIRVCRDTLVRFRTLPGMQDLLEGSLLSMQLRDISVEDLLRRAPAEINLAEIAAYLTGKTVLVTGAGGSIGSEICRQVLPFQPQAILLMGHGENSIYLVHQDLSAARNLGQTRLVQIIADVKDEARVDAIFQEYHPDIVFHAAAHKHVPLMEINPEEAVKNNILGTYNLVNASHQYHSERFVMISTDKAVNPTSVMGASKRFSEMVMKVFAKRSATRFCAVRFGNVLGSRGSVIPLFKRQIEAGGPVTITHPNMIRFFMTIPEASKLVIQAGSYGKGGEVFLLDMGEPVRICDLASDLIRLAGLEEGQDIKIEYSGVRPGEKMYEELLTTEEGVTATRNKKIFIARPEMLDEEVVLSYLSELRNAAVAGDRPLIIGTLKIAIPSYAPDRDQIYNHHNLKNDLTIPLKKARPKFKVV